MSPRPLLDPSQRAPAAAAVTANFHRDTVDEVIKAVTTEHIVVVGMGWNPFVRKACRALADAKIPFRFLCYGNYMSAWKPRLAIKMWSGWPTFPQVYVDGRLIGGMQELQVALQNNEIPSEATPQK